MSQFRQFQRCHPVALACLSLLHSALCAGPALSQPLPGKAPADQQGSPGAANLALPAQPLAQTLASLSRQFSTAIGGEGALLEGKSSPALQGRLTLQQALERALSTSGLTYVRSGSGSLTVVRPSAAQEATLPVVTIVGQSIETGAGPVSGYVARRTLTAAKDDTVLMETAQSVAVVTRDQMDEQGAQNVTEALRYVAGVNTSAYGDDPRYDWITVRGFNQSVFGLYRDGLRASGSKIGMRIDSYGLERIDVLKGPTSVLYGQNAPGGLVNAVTKRPTGESFREVSVGLGSYDRKQMQFDMGGVLDKEGALSWRLTGNLRDSNTQMDYAPDDHSYIAPALTWKPDGRTSFTVLTNFQRDNAAWGLWYQRTGTLFPSAYGQTSSSFYPGEPSFNSFKRNQASITTLFEHELDNGLVFRQGLRAERMRYDARFVRGRALLNDDYAPDETGHLLYRDANRNRLNSKVYAMDNQLSGKLRTGDIQHHLLVGLDVSRTEYEDRQWSGRAPVLDITAPVYGMTIAEPTSLYARDLKADQTGLYLQDRMDIGRDWIVRGGVRHDWTRTNIVDPQGSFAQRQRNGATTWQAGVLYKGFASFAPFANYAQSFQPTTDASRSGATFKPTEGRSLEAGVRYQPQGSRGMLTASVFDIEQNNVLTQDPTDPTNVVQTGQVRSRGAEFEAAWDVTRQLSLVAAYTYLDAKVTRSNTLGQVGTRPQDAWGTTSPRNMASLWANYRFATGALRGVSIGGGARHMGSTLDYGATGADPDNAYATAVKTPAYTVYDMVLGYDYDTHWKFQFRVNNLSDKLYVANPCGGSQLGTCFYGPRRNVLATTTYRW